MVSRSSVICPLINPSSMLLSPKHFSATRTDMPEPPQCEPHPEKSLPVWRLMHRMAEPASATKQAHFVKRIASMKKLSRRYACPAASRDDHSSSWRRAASARNALRSGVRTSRSRWQLQAVQTNGNPSDYPISIRTTGATQSLMPVNRPTQLAIPYPPPRNSR